MTVREKIIKAVLEMPEKDLDWLYQQIKDRTATKPPVEETLAALAEIRATQTVTTDAAQLVREGREELEKRAFRR